MVMPKTSLRPRYIETTYKRYPTDYIIEYDGRWNARNAKGTIEYHNDSDAVAVINDVLNVGDGVKVVVQDAFSVGNTPIKFLQNTAEASKRTILELYGLTITHTGTGDVIQIGDPSHAAYHVIVGGGKIERASKGGQYGIHFYDAHRSYAEDVTIRKLTTGVMFEGSWSSGLRGPDTWIVDGDYAVKITSTAVMQSNAVRLLRAQLYGTVADVLIEKGSGEASQDIEINQCVLADSPIGLKVRAATNLNIIRSYFENNINYDIQFVGDEDVVQSPKVLGNWFLLKSATSRGIRCETVYKPVIAFNTVRRASASGVFIESTSAAQDIHDLWNDLGGGITNSFATGTLKSQIQHDGKAILQDLDHGNLAGLGDDNHPQYLNVARHDLTARHPLGTVVPHDNLADLIEKLHSSLTGVTASQHHTKYMDAEAVAAVEAVASLDLSGNLTTPSNKSVQTQKVYTNQIGKRTGANIAVDDDLNLASAKTVVNPPTADGAGGGTVGKLWIVYIGATPYYVRLHPATS